ncbi:MAG: LysE family translocator [Pseudomonadota bacterium]
MTITTTQLALYAGALFVLFITPGPVWLAVLARAISGGFRAAIPLSLGVAVGDVLWALLVVLGLSVVADAYDGTLTALRFVAGGILIWMGWMVVRSAGALITGDSTLTKPGFGAGFVAGLIAVGANPKASVFYLALLPGFFDVGTVNATDTLLICATSFCVPLMGNLALALFVDRIRAFLKSPQAVRRTNLAAGIMLIIVGLIIPFTA